MPRDKPVWGEGVENGGVRVWGPGVEDRRVQCSRSKCRQESSKIRVSPVVTPDLVGTGIPQHLPNRERCFLGVVVITFASHAKGGEFDPRRKQVSLLGADAAMS